MRRIAVVAALLACKPAPVAAPVQVAASPAANPIAVRGDPNADTDGDGIADARDRCPGEPEDIDTFEDEDGCVDRDNDGDGILDAHEFIDGRWTNCDYVPADPLRAMLRGTLYEGVDTDCRNLPEDRDGVSDHDGCPDIYCFDLCQMRLPERLHFDARGRFAADSAARLDAVAAIMKTLPNVPFFVDAHVDARRDKAAAKQLTKQLAAQAIEQLVRRGVVRERLQPRNWGDDMPIARNDDAAGRAANRRVEFEVAESCSSCGPPPDKRPPEQHDCR